MQFNGITQNDHTVESTCHYHNIRKLTCQRPRRRLLQYWCFFYNCISFSWVFLINWRPSVGSRRTATARNKHFVSQKSSGRRALTCTVATLKTNDGIGRWTRSRVVIGRRPCHFCLGPIRWALCVGVSGVIGIYDTWMVAINRLPCHSDHPAMRGSSP